jgi:DNA-binding MarR family transcriptional regulator
VATEIMHKAIHELNEPRVHARRTKSLPLAQAAELEELLSRLARKMFVLVPEHPTSKLSIMQLRACSILQQGPRPVSNLGRELGVRTSNVSQIVERMVRMGLVERYVSADDRRLRLVKLSPQGLQAMESRQQHRFERAVGALSRLDPPVRQKILLALRGLLDAASTASPYRVVAGAAPERITRVMRETDLTTGYCIEDVCENCFDSPE